MLAAIADGRIPLGWFWSLLKRTAAPGEPVIAEGQAKTPGEAVRAEVARLGGGAYLGVGRSGGWVLADPESAVMVLGPPRSGKTSAVMIPAVMGAPGAADRNLDEARGDAGHGGGAIGSGPGVAV